jgi:hypothetical protein
VMHFFNYRIAQADELNCIWSRPFSIAMTSEKSNMVSVPCSVPIAAMMLCRANDFPRCSTGNQQRRSGEEPSEPCQEIQPFSSFHARASARECEKSVIEEVYP